VPLQSLLQVAAAGGAQAGGAGGQLLQRGSG